MEDKLQVIEHFDPNGVGVQGSLFGLPFSSAHAEVIVIPVPWEVTVSYHKGTSAGPKAILEASTQVDLYLEGIPEAWKAGIFMLPIPDHLTAENERFRRMVEQYIDGLTQGTSVVNGFETEIIPRVIDEACEQLNIYVRSLAHQYLEQGKLPCVLGGDHSTSLGLIRALAERHRNFGVLQIDAHADLRKSYENFKYSHASAMYNVLRLPAVSKLVQVGLRDCCEEEIKRIHNSQGKIIGFFDQALRRELYEGRLWSEICDTIIDQLPKYVYISFDIDGLDPRYCPSTGTPVPGGLDYSEALYLIRALVNSGRVIIGFDLVEVASSPEHSDWDANVGARLLYQLSSLMAVSQGRLRFGHL